MSIPFTIDRFACSANTLLPVFNSYFYEPKTAGVDAFAQQDYYHHVNFLHAPLSIMGKLTLFIE